MCREYKLDCRNRCWQLLNSCPATMVNFIWFTDDKLLKFYHCSQKKCPKRSLSHTCGDSLTFTPSSKTVHQHTPLARWLNFSIAECLISCQCCLVLTRWTFFISEPDKVHHRSRVVTNSTSWNKQACTHDTLWRQRYVTTNKEYLTINQISTKYFEFLLF